MKKTLSKNTPVGFCQKILLLLFLCFSTLTYAQGQSKTVTGTVIDEFNDPLIGVSVVIKGTTHGTMTDIDGKFTLKIEDPKSVIVFSLVGFKKSEITVGNQTVIDLVMKEDTQLLDEVVVIGFQSQKKVNMTASVSRVGAETLENRPVSNIGEALQGVVPNLNITIPSGAPNEVPTFNIRGGTSINDKGQVQNGAPLIMVDGVEVVAHALNQINPNDIADISVLKDASAAAIYGTRATFGVILVQTKSGSFNAKSKINYSFDMSWDQPIKHPDLMNSYDILQADLNRSEWTGQGAPTPDQLRKLGYMKRYLDDPTPYNAWYPTSGNKDEMTPEELRKSDINWVASIHPYKEALREWTPTAKHNVSISGGSDKVSYYASLGIMDQTGMIKLGEDKFKRYNAMVSLNAKVTSWFNLGAKVSYNVTKYNSPVTNVPGKGNVWHFIKSGRVSEIINTPLFSGPDDPLPNHATENGLAYLSSGATQTNKRRMGLYTISPEFIIIPKELRIKMDYSFTDVKTDTSKKQPHYQRINDSWVSLWEVSTDYNYGEVGGSGTDKYVFNIYADYNKTLLKEHNISALLGFNQERDKGNSYNIYMRRLIDYNILKPGAVEDETLNTSSYSGDIKASRAMFTRLMYNYQGKYLAEFDARYDGSSKFPKSDRFLFFPTFSLGWRMSEEKFMDFSKEWLDSFKFRYSWGKLGSQPGAIYPYQPKIKSESGKFQFAGRYPNVLYPGDLINPAIAWEKSVTNNVGIDAAFLKSRLDLTFDTFHRKTIDILLQGGTDYPALLGATPPLENVGEVRSTGWELALNWRDKLHNGINYNFGVVLSDSRTKIISFPGNRNNQLKWDETDYKNGVVNAYTGKWDGEIWGFESGGILQAADFDADGNYYGAKFLNEDLYPGMAWYQDLNGDGIINTGSKTVDDPGDLKVIGNTTPRYRYGITAGASWKGVDISMFFQGVGKRDVWIGSNSSYWGEGAGSYAMLKQSWTPENTGAKYPIYGTNFRSRMQSGYLVDGSYFSMKQLIVGYTLPAKLIKKAGIEKLRVNMSAYNLFTISDIPKNFDVERVSDVYPPKRTIAIGVQVGF